MKHYSPMYEDDMCCHEDSGSSISNQVTYYIASEADARIGELEQAIKDLLVCAQGIGWFPREAERWKHAATLVGQSHRVK